MKLSIATLCLTLAWLGISKDASAIPTYQGNNHAISTLRLGKRAALIRRLPVFLKPSTDQLLPSTPVLPRFAAHVLMLIADQSYILQKAQPNYEGSGSIDPDTNIAWVIDKLPAPIRKAFLSQIQMEVGISVLAVLEEDVQQGRANPYWYQTDYDIYVDISTRVGRENPWGTLTMTHQDPHQTVKGAQWNSTLRSPVNRTYIEPSSYNNTTSLTTNTSTPSFLLRNDIAAAPWPFKFTVDPKLQSAPLNDADAIALFSTILRDHVWTGHSPASHLAARNKVGATLISATVNGWRLEVTFLASQRQNYEFRWSDVSRALRQMILLLKEEGSVSVSADLEPSQRFPIADRPFLRVSVEKVGVWMDDEGHVRAKLTTHTGFDWRSREQNATGSIDEVS